MVVVMREIKKECKACEYFEPMYGVDDLGWCKYNAPVVVSDQCSCVWPVIASDQFCGQFHLKVHQTDSL
jgi:hypothetical protein